MSEKNQKPTAKRIRDARGDGQVAVSPDVGMLIQGLVLLLWLSLEGPALFRALAENILLAIAVGAEPLPRALARYAGHLGGLALRFVFGLAIALAIALVLSGMLQTGFLFAPKALKFKPERLDPAANLKNLFAARNLFELAKSALKVVLLGLTFAYLIGHYGPTLAQLGRTDLWTGVAVASRMLLWMVSVLLAASAVFAIADYGMQRWHLLRQLRMSRQDIRQEHKNSEGDPQIRQRRRELHREVQSGSLAAGVAQASVVVRNPGHIAIGLRFVAGETPLPRVVAQGRGHRARLIVALARRQDIPVVESRPLARALLRQTRPGDYIPEALFAAVALLLRQLETLAAEASPRSDRCAGPTSPVRRRCGRRACASD